MVNGRWGVQFCRNTALTQYKHRGGKWEACQEGSAGLKHFTFIDIEETRTLVKYFMMSPHGPVHTYFRAFNNKVAEVRFLRKGD